MSQDSKTDEKSRLGITLQGYDQVIAISQAHINAALRYRFKHHAILRTFDESSSVTYANLKADMGTPEIELRENLDKGTGALLVLQFVDGFFNYWQMTKPDQPPGWSGPPMPPTPKLVQIPTRGWKFAFTIDLSLQTIADLPPEDKKDIDIPGLYTVSQLMLDLSKADLATPNWQRSLISGLDTNPNTAADQRSMITQFVGAYIEKLKLADGNHYILGHAVTSKSLDESKKITPEAPNFVPRQLRIQAMNYHLDDNPKAVETSHNNNAFLFTEMSYRKDMPDKPLTWSGNWFTSPFGGTMIMAREVFIEAYLLSKLSILNKSVLQALNAVTFWLADPNQATKASYPWSIAQTEPSDTALPFTHEPDGFKWTWKGKWDDVKTIWGFLNSSSETKGTRNDVDVTSKLILTPGSCTITIETSATVTTEWQQTSTVFGGGASAGSGSSDEKRSIGKMSWKTDIILRNILSTDEKLSGKLQVDLAIRDFNCTAEITASRLILFTLFPGGKPRIDEELQKKAREEIEKRMKAIDLVGPMRTALNGQSRFIFPGGGTFDFKDPVFGNTGDLLISLSYQQRLSDP